MNKEQIINKLIYEMRVYRKKIEDPKKEIRKMTLDYFYDGECLDIGVGLLAKNKETGLYERPYYSFTLENEEVKKMIQENIAETPKENVFSELVEICEKVVDELKGEFGNLLAVNYD